MMLWSQVGDLDINSSPGTGGWPDPGPQQDGPHCWKKVATAILVETRLGKLWPLSMGQGGTSRFTVVSRNLCLSICFYLCQSLVTQYLRNISWISPYLTESHHIWLNITISHRILPTLTKYRISQYLIKSQPWISALNSCVVNALIDIKLHIILWRINNLTLFVYKKHHRRAEFWLGKPR